MAQASRIDGWGGVFKIWGWAIVLQGLIMWGLSYLFMNYVLTEDHFNAMTALPGGPISSLPIFQKVAYYEQGFLILIAQNNKIFVNFMLMLLAGIIYFNFKKRDQEITNYAAIFMAVFLCMALLTHWWFWVFLAECAPFWALLTAEFNSGSYDGDTDSNIAYVSHGEFQRGVMLVKYNNNSKAFARLTAKETPKDGKAGISIVPDDPFPYVRENQHLLAIGSPGSGKTQIIYPMVSQVYLRPGDKAIVWDVKGAYIQALAGEPGVDLLAVWDKRSIDWSPGADVQSQLDCKELADILIPLNPKDSQPFFINSARTTLEAILMYLEEQGNEWGWGDVWETVSKDRKDLALLLSSFRDGRVAAGIIGGDGKSSDDVYSTLMTHVQQTIRWYAKAWPKRGVSLKKWIHGNSKLLIIGGIPQRADLAKATANIAIEMMVKEILSLPDDPNRRIWLFLDELATLGKLDALLEAFSLGRSKGLCVVAGIQDIGKLEHLYGYNLAKSITNTFSTMIVLRCSDVETSQWASKVLGDQDILETQRSTGSSTKGWGQDEVTSSSEQKVHRTRALFTPSQISHFPNLDGVIRVSGWPLLDIRWPYRPIPQAKPIVIEAGWINIKEKLTES